MFMKRSNALKLLLDARQSAIDRAAGMSVDDTDAQLEALNRLIFDVRACRINEFQIDPADEMEIVVTD
ncbi:hypothetical protein [Burkholderia sp. BCC1985]|uniref:hypothetical protein n=2 Tax=unclassified Burkholderia TaxID=2613784 RepID=UPI002AAF1665|nr:hypothetical protein [Burkholderia sp. BCC1985]